MEPSTEFLTPEESAEVDKALMTAHDKFATRVAIYALRSLKQIAQQNSVAIATLDSQQIEDWVYQDESLRQGIDREFKQFFSHLVISSQTPLKRAAEEAGVAIEGLTVPQVVAWFERNAKRKLEET
ncbi:hypothetical protein K9N68_16870 [Kovacikia minuta CCNUW1]|uniref:hypothetical protein n=1 Tax=Kovacikia minuta TaxID=2931930 RepID=UPI001CCF85FA|nr:hypothetical protein [Kovacikia minuta]UBF29355.1 hypothetical protein K9N68_16870 [Kovacikia minuta CCNUW1]